VRDHNPLGSGVVLGAVAAVPLTLLLAVVLVLRFLFGTAGVSSVVAVPVWLTEHVLRLLAPRAAEELAQLLDRGRLVLQQFREVEVRLRQVVHELTLLLGQRLALRALDDSLHLVHVHLQDPWRGRAAHRNLDSSALNRFGSGYTRAALSPPRTAASMTAILVWWLRASVLMPSVVPRSA